MGGKLEAEVARFNEQHSIGTPVQAWPWVVNEGEPLNTVTTTEAYVLSGHTAVIHVKGVRGCIALSHIEPSGAEESER